MLESKVTLAPRLRGASKHAREPLRDHPQIGESEVLVEHSSTNTKRLPSSLPDTRARQAALKNSSLSLAATLRLLGSSPSFSGASKGWTRSPKTPPSP